MARRGAAAVLAILGLTLLLLAPSAGFAKPKPKPKPLPQEQVPLWDENAGDGVCNAVSWFREQFPEVKRQAERRRRSTSSTPTGRAGDDRGSRATSSRRAPSIPDEPKGHSERRLIKIVEQLGIDPDTVEVALHRARALRAPGRLLQAARWRPSSGTRGSTTRTRIRTAARTRPPRRRSDDDEREDAGKKEVAGFQKQLQATKGIMGAGQAARCNAGWPDAADSAGSTSRRSSSATSRTPAASAVCATRSAPTRPRERPTRRPGSRRHGSPRTPSSPGWRYRRSRSG